MATISSTIDDTLRQDASHVLSSPEIPLLEAPEFALAADELDLAASLTLPEDTPRLLSPLQIKSSSTKPKHLFDALLKSAKGGLESLGPEIANAEMNIAGDGSFIESSSGAAIRELKPRFDQLAGVGPTLRSPYAITGFVNQHGKTMYRLGRRDEQAPAASTAGVEDRMSQSKATSDSSHSPRTKRRSRLSMHFLPPSIFKNSAPAHPPSGRSKIASTSSSKKLHRKTGSTPDLTGTTNGDVEPTFAVTGRGHSQSVTSVDMVRASLIFQSPLQGTDAFGEVLDLIPSSNASSISVFTDSTRARGMILQPFGPGVLFNSPNKKGQVDRLRPPRQLREMHSFESAVTARQDDDHLETYQSEPDHELSRPPSAIRLSELMSHSEALDTPELLELSYETDSDTDDTISSQFTQYSTEVFNVIQKYSGLPVFESLVPEVDEGTSVIRLSLSTTMNSAPRDDPRFVIWGELQPDPYDDLHSGTRDSPTETSSSLPLSTLSRRQSSKASRSKLSDASSSRLAPPEDGQRVLLAATIERWIAQLTSDLDYDELLNFFLTYRAYVSSVDLCHLLICRFHWTLQKAASREDEAVHRIVRVRTFVAIRYWLLTFFAVDFIPNRELRLLIADWLNALLHDPVLKKHMDGVGIIRRLIKVAKDCKKAHIKAVDKPKEPSPPPPEPHHVLGKSFAQAIRKDDESDLDLDFLPDEATTEEAATGFQSDPANAHLTVGHVAGAVVLGRARPTSLPLSSFGILQRPDHAPEPALQNVQLPPVRHSALSRAFVKTIGRLGRWKRAFQPKSPTLTPNTRAPGVGGVSAFDLELNGSVDFLTPEKGIGEYLKMAKSPTTPAKPPVSVSVTSSLTVVAGAPTQLPTTPAVAPITSKQLENLPPTPESPMAMPFRITSSPTPVNDTVPSLPSPPLSPILNAIAVPGISDTIAIQQHETPEIFSMTPHNEPRLFDQLNVEHGTERPESFHSASTDSFGAPLASDGPLSPTFPGTHAQWQFDVVSIDDLDFSDTSSLPSIQDPPGLRKLRKLPMRRDFEFVRRSEVSSMGIISQESLRDSMNSSTPSETSPTSSLGAGPKPIQRWQMKSLQQTFEEMSNDSDDKGGVDAALRRLEGQINPKVLQENSEKVDGWLHNLRERMTNGDYANSVYSEDEVEGFFDELDVTSPISPMTDDAEDSSIPDVNPHTPLPTHSTHQLPTPPGVDVSPKDTQSRIEAVVPVEILQSRMSLPANPPYTSRGLSKYGKHSPYRSFILGCPSEQLANHFSMIDRELFMSIKFEELVTGEWLESDEIDILDWAQFLKDRARWKAESRHSNKTTALAAVRARFNLMVSFVNAEVVLTPTNARPLVVSKFIRLAWRCYQVNNFQSLTAIITGLQSDWVTTAMRKPGWGRLSDFETRIFADLKQFTSKQDDFRIMRQVVESTVDSKPLDSSSRTPSIISGSNKDSLSGRTKRGSSSGRPVGPSPCIPFIGIYLSRLRRLNKLPAVIDPTSPNTFMFVDPITTDFHLPAFPDVFSSLAPLPSSMRLEPLINVQKQRRVAEVIKSLVAGQHLASTTHFQVDRKLFQKCLRLRGLDAVSLQQALNIQTD